MGTLLLDGVTKRYGEALAVAGVDLDIRQGELVALLGPSGCGKTTTLRMVAGFIEPTAGRIVIGGRDVTRQPPHARDTGMVFQSYALFPHMSVADNVGFGLEMRKVGKAERDRRIAEALRLVRLDALADRLPRQLSGGQQQRVALARALVVSPAVFLLDEPLSNLDAKLRSEVGLEIRELQKRLGLTTLMVTHDQDEALAMADRLVVMEHGRVLQVGSAEDLYERPANTFVAGFVGRCNLLDGAREGADVFRLASGAALPCTPDATARTGMLAIRPERIEVAPDPAGTGRLRAVTYLGARTEYHLELAGEAIVAVTSTPLPDDPRRRLAAGDPVRITWAADAARVIPAAEGPAR
ncbi:ABC transporter ATP-binding protein [Methylobacterium platani]|uniref:Fe3+/spermidine/putrescine ABC transporter ATP-binding protein n=2 Tax=Methylobacterium platani TaxID=427683 RepID=A0A179SHD9_9HYPH|nr:ABC transporter ATP-binding protein [Methylobacterium platani]KMO11314.1 spermidine/putrescine ABC transporter ATPase [Methylobacterium platani JCM 14648]OAS26400.1 Fe3+/spermidine/putrescine ABC transporter ATP-binding protein [Methylobacterium platani]